MGCVYSKPEPQEREPITIDQLEKELFNFNKNIRGYWRRKKTFCLRRVKPKNPQSPAPSCAPTAADEKRPCDGKPSKCQGGKDTCASAYPRTPTNQRHSNTKEIKQDAAPGLLRSVYSKTEPGIQRCLSLESMPSATRSLPLPEWKLSEASQVTVSDIVLSSKKSVQHMYMQEDWKSVLEYFHRDTRYNPNRHYNIIREIGEGTFGHVYLAKHNEIQDEEYAIKTISLEDPDEKSLVMELEVLRTCSHENILTLKDSYLTDTTLYVVTQYVAGVSLYTLSNVTEGLTEKVVASILKECLQGLAYLHSHEYIHCDIKGENILIGIDRQVKIADFGLVIRMTEERPRGFRGTKMFASPEMANSLPYGNEIDIWSLGIVAIEMVQGYPPLQDATNFQCFITMAKSGYNSMNEEAASKASDDLKDFLYNGALKYNPADRLTANELLSHPFMLQGDNCQCLPLVVDWVMQEQMNQEDDAG